VTLFLFTDDIEEFLVVARDADDAFAVIDEELGPNDDGDPTADTLILSKLYEYPDDFEFGPGITAAYFVAGGRRLVAHRDLQADPHRYKKPAFKPVAVVGGAVQGG
jgi:hypothetical protein